MGNEHAKNSYSSLHKRASMTAAKDARHLLSQSASDYPNAWEYVIYGFIREFIEQNLWVEWSKHKVIPKAIKTLLTQYLKTELIVTAGTTLTLASDVYHEFEHILIKKNAILTVQPWHYKTQKGGKLLLKTDHNITLEESAQINVESKGYSGGYFCESGESHTGKGTKNDRESNGGGGGGGKGSKSSGYSKCRGAGGGYGTKGSDMGKAKGGEVYGDEYITVLYLGSGGGGGYNNGITENESGGNGGGVIEIQCKGEIILEKDSLITANGGNSVYGGGGSGGSIKISCEKMKLDGNIYALGGEDKDGNVGGDGRIRVSMKGDLGSRRKFQPVPHVDNDFVGAYAE